VEFYTVPRNMEARLGRYVVLKHLASGGMADVLLGRSDGIEGFVRHVVLKRIRAEHASDQRFIRMFLDEARVAATLHHQHIVQVHDVGESDGEYFIAMEYLHGKDVRALLSAAARSRSHVPLGHTIAIVSAAAAGLHHAHERRSADGRSLGIVHRDVSPSNILIGYDGSIKLLDFGIVKATGNEQTRTGSLKGKIAYLSPEQCKGAPVDRRTDVYALGVVLYELATTTRLFKGDSDFHLMEQIVHGRVALPQVRRPDLPDGLATIIMRALSPEPDRRYASADELRLALDEFAARAGLTASTSAIAAYMRKQFGVPPEPWAELGGAFGDSFDDRGARPPVDETSARAASATRPRSDDTFRASSSIPVITGPIDLVTAPGAEVSLPAGAPARDAARSAAPSRPSVSNLDVAIPPRPERGRIPRRAALIGAPLAVVALLGVALWLHSGSDAAEPVAAAILPPPAAPPPPPPPTSTPAAAPAATPVTSPLPTDVTVAKTTHSSPPRTRSASPPPRRAEQARLADVARVDARVELPVATTPAASPASTATAPVLGPAPSPPPPAPEPAPAPAPPPAAPQNVAPTALDANRIAGDREIRPDPGTQSEISRAGVAKITGAYKLCLTAAGSVGSVTPLKSTGFASYDDKITTTIRTRWRYRPFMVNGKAVPVCTAVRFIYMQS